MSPALQALLTVPICTVPVLVAAWLAERPGRADRAERAERRR